jgi:predicted PurR-regulated permease PerM
VAHDPDTGSLAASSMAASDAAAVGVSGDAMERAEAEAARARTDEAPLGQPGRPVNRRSPFFVGLFGAAGVATTVGLAELVVAARDVLVLVGLALFLAIGLDPAVRWLCRRMPRWAAVSLVALAMVVTVAGFLAAAIPPLVSQAGAFANALPHYLHLLQDRSSLVGRLNERYHLQQRLTQELAAGSGTGAVGGLVGAGQMVLSVTARTVTVLVLTLYFLVDLPHIRQLIYRLLPASRRARAIVLGDEMFAKVGGFVLGNLITSAIAGAGTFVWLAIFRVPYPLLLSLMVALLDLIPIVGSTVAGIIVTLVALTVSVPVAIATLVFYIVYRLAEDYLIVPRVMGTVIAVPATVTFVAVLIGGAVLGIVGALVAIPAAAAIRLVLQEALFPRLDRL